VIRDIAIENKVALPAICRVSTMKVAERILDGKE
jgi:hypothetical protein